MRFTKRGVLLALIVVDLALLMLPLSMFPQALVGAGASGSPAASGGGVLLYASHKYSDLSDFNVVGTAPTINSFGQLVFSNTSGTVAGQQLIIKNLVSNSENWTMKVTITIGTVGTSQWGFVLVRKSVNPFAKSGIAMNYSTNATSIALSMLNGDTQTNCTSCQYTIVNPAVGDVVTITLSQRGTQYIYAEEDLTSGVKVTGMSSSNLLSSQKVALANTSQFALYDFGGTYTLNSWSVTDDDVYSPNLCFAGDSKMEGYGSGGLPARFASMFRDYGPVEVFSGGGDTIVEMLAATPAIIAKHCKNIIILYGYNDAGWGVPLSTYQADYASVVSQLEAAGTRVFPMLSIPSNANVSASQVAPFNAFLTTTYGATHTVLDPSVGFDITTMLYVDKIHVNAVGNLQVAASLRSQLGAVLASNPNALAFTPALPVSPY